MLNIRIVYIEDLNILCGGFLCCRMYISNVGIDPLNTSCTTTSHSITIIHFSRYCQIPADDQNHQNQPCFKDLLLNRREEVSLAPD